MNEQQLKRVIGYLAEEKVPSDCNPWPAIQAHFEMSKKRTKKGELSMNIIFARHWRLATAILIPLVAIITFLFATPQGNALAQEILSFFTRAHSDVIPIPPQQLTKPAGTSTPEAGFMVDKSILDVEKQAGFGVQVPTWLPDALSLNGASIEPENNDIVRIFYQIQGTNVLVLREETFKTADDCVVCGWVGTSAKIETVQLDSYSGEFVEGVWKLVDGNYVWEPDPFMKTLRWQVNGMAFELLYMGPPDNVTKDDMVRIATSLK